MRELLVGAIEGRVVELRDGSTLISVNDSEDDWEDVCDWIVNNLPNHGTYVRIVVMTFPEIET